jgi:hypothetical protein
MKGPRGRTIVGSLLIALVVGVLAATAAVAATAVVTLEELAPETVVSTQYQGSHGVVFNGPAADGNRPVVKTVAGGIAHSGTRVADISTCPGCEFATSSTIGRLTSTASQVQAYVGYVGAPSSAQAQVTLVARNTDGQTIGTSAATVTQGQPFTQLVSVTAPAATIASFELTTDPPFMTQPVAFDDLALTSPDGQPPDFALEVSGAPVTVGSSVDVPIVIHRLNGSNGDVTLRASGLPARVSASFLPNPVQGTGAATVLRLSAAPGAAAADSTITITGTPVPGAGTTSRNATLAIRTTPDCRGSVIEVRPVPGQRRVSSAPQLAKVLETATHMRVVVPAGANWEMVDCAGKPLRKLELKEGVELVGEPSALGRRPRLWTRVVAGSAEDKNLPLFKSVGDDVLLQGLHLDGPFKPKDSGGDKGVVALVVDRDPSYEQGRLIVTDNEIEGFRNAVSVGGLVQVRDAKEYDAAYEAFYGVDCPGTCPRPDKSEAGKVRVEYNYIHNHARKGGGYGVVVGGAAYARVTGNVFEYNNHSVAASGKAFSGYLASRNFVLQGAIDHKDHHFDIHGTLDPGHWAGGDAGTYFDISSNTIRGEQDYSLGFNNRKALGLRGRPTQGAQFHNNVMVHDGFDEAVKLSAGDDDRLDEDRPSTFRLSYRGNKADTDYSTEIAAGDFDGDRRTDVFVANGTAWFFSSAGIRPWEFMHSSTTRTKDLAFADVDNDGITDVIWQSAGGKLRYLKRGASAGVVLPSAPVDLKKLRFGDFDGDGLTDIFYTRNREWHVWYGSTHSWTRVGGSVTPVTEMLLGEFDGVRGTDIAAVRNNQWSYSSGATGSWARLNSKRTGSFAKAVAADFDGNGRTDIAITDGLKWRYSPDGRGPLKQLRQASVAPPLHHLLVGPFDGGRKAMVLGWKLVQPLPLRLVPGTRFVLWRGLGSGNGFVQRSEQNMR